MHITTSLILLVIRLLNVYRYIIFARVLLSWVIRDPSNPIYNALLVLTEPVMAPIRNIMSRIIRGPIDFSPIVAFLLIQVVANFLISIL